ncbi:MAG: thioredoxin family protein [Deltaproteobacteria bacterium]|nr:thioredoxin family protein [Deltaproteobacteria bacterium]
MRINHLTLLTATVFLFLTMPVGAQEVKTITVKKDTITAKAATKSKTKTAVKKKTVAKADSLKPKPVKLPRMVDLGAGKCIPCKMMAPILDKLEKDLAGKLEVVFIDVWQNADEGSKYKIRVIPTQIFYSPEGKELFRHEGFYSREDILAKWKELGFEFKQ